MNTTVFTTRLRGSLSAVPRAGAIALAALLAISASGTALAQRGGSGGGHAAVGGGFAGRGFAGRGFAGRPYGGYGYRGYYGYGYPWGWGWGLGWGLGLGLWLSALPWDYSTYWWDGVPYYYAGGGYYVWVPSAGQYQQVQPPAQVAQQASAPQSIELFAYPKNGQSVEQQNSDKAQCVTWAQGQTGFNPADAATVPAPGPAAGAAPPAAGPPPPNGPAGSGGADRRATFLRAEAACLEGRGYSVR